MVFDLGISQWFRPTKSNGRAVLFFHGWTGWVPDVVPTVKALVDQGYTVYCPRFTAHAEDCADRSRFTNSKYWKRDAYSAYYQMLSEFAPERVFIAGVSMGGVVAAKLASKVKCAGAMLYAPAVYAKEKVMFLTPLLSLFDIEFKVPNYKYRYTGVPQYEQMEKIYWNHKSARWAWNLWKMQLWLRWHKFELKVPAMVVFCNDDDAVDPKAISWLKKRSTKLTEFIHETGGHVITGNSSCGQTINDTLFWLMSNG